MQVWIFLQAVSTRGIGYAHLEIPEFFITGHSDSTIYGLFSYGLRPEFHLTL